MRGLVALTTVAVLAIGATVALSDDDSGPTTTARPVTGVRAAGAGLEAFDACDGLVDHLAATAVADPWGGPMGFAVGGATETEAAVDQAEGAVPAPAADGASARDAATSGTSDTNVQVAGVDELDIVETDGRRLFMVVDGRLQVVDVATGTPHRLGELDLGLPEAGDGELLLHDGRLLVVLRSWSDAGLRPRPMDGMADRAMPMGGTALTSLVVVDVAGDAPREVARTEVEGELVAGRGVDGTAHLVVAHRPQPLPAMAMEAVWAAPDEDAAVREMQRALGGTTAADWLPALRHVDARGDVTSASAVACTDVVRPTGTTDGAMLQVLTLDVHGDDAMPEATTALLTDARTVTASATELVVATPVRGEAVAGPAGGAPAPAVDAIGPAPGTGTTRLHLFDLGPDGTTHRATGEVPGMLLNQFSMSLHDGMLRVATTTGDAFAGGTESGVVVLRPSGDRLEVVGSVGGLGRGETIHAVRFLGERAHVVTFRQTDPLYTIDLSDPAEPTVTGELKITGYSAYLHPLAGDRLLGVGQEATSEGRVTGTQVSVFDVADPAAPTRVSQVMLPGATSEAEWDHHAVLVHEGLVVLPYERWMPATPERPEGYEAAAMVLQVDGDLVTLRGTVAGTEGATDPWRSAVRRAVVVDGRLVTVSRAEVRVHDPATLTTTGMLDL